MLTFGDYQYRSRLIVGPGRYPSVEVLDTFAGEPILVRAGRLVCATFHPELTGDPGLHRDLFNPVVSMA